MKNKDRKRIFLSPPHMCGEDLRFVKEALESNYIAPLGPMVDAFEKEFAVGVYRDLNPPNKGCHPRESSLKGLGF